MDGLPVPPPLLPGPGRPALTEPLPPYRDERITWALRRGVERAAGRRIGAPQAAELLVSLSAPDAAFGFAAGVPGGAIDATRDYTESLVEFLRGILGFYAIVYDPGILVPSSLVWLTPPGSPERAQLMEFIAKQLAVAHPEVAEALRWIPVLEIAIGEFCKWLKTDGALMEIARMAGDGLAEVIGEEIGKLIPLATPFDRGLYLGQVTGYVITTVLLELFAF
jgi:hypothetical protein